MARDCSYFIKRFIVFFYRGGKYSENDAKPVIIQILNVVAFCHFQGVVHRDLKPEVRHNFELERRLCFTFMCRMFSDRCFIIRTSCTLPRRRILSLKR